jgi:amino acid transporter
MASYCVGFLNWIAYVAVAPMEVTALVEYTSDFLPGLTITVGGEPELSAPGLGVAIPLLLLCVIINYFGVRLLARINQPLAIWKLVVPATTVVAFGMSRFETANFTAYGGFAPGGINGVPGAVTSGGAILAFLGFRSVLEMAGEVRNPQRDIPVAMLGGIGFCILLYFLLDITFAGSLSPNQLANGWKNLAQSAEAGPIAAIALQLGLGWLASLLFIDAVVSPGGTALIYTGVAARVGRAMSRNGLFPMPFQKMNRFGVPAVGIFVNFCM